MRKAMAITVGTGRTVAHGITCAIQSQSPTFVLFIGTEESIKKTLPTVLENTGLEENQYEVRTTSYPNDVQRASLECVDHIKWLTQMGYTSKEIVVDFTSGTKAMSTGLVVAALTMEVARVSYVQGERDENGRVISGTERVTSLEPNRLVVKKRMDWAIQFFNCYQFDGCLAVLSDVEGRIGAPDVVEQLTLLTQLAKAYSAWDRFALKTAMEHFKGLEKYPLLPKWGLKKQVAQNNAALHQEVASDYNPFKAVDLMENAKRRAEESKFDDTGARLYRLIEYLAQVKLYSNHQRLLTGDLDITKLPDELRSKYEPLRNSKGKIELGLAKSYELLDDLGDPLGRHFMQNYKLPKNGVKVALGMRNASILAHGFGPIGEEGYNRFLRTIKDYLDYTFDDWQRLAENVRFPKIRI